MVDHLSIHNFKSIKNLDLDCRRINILIGEPGTGKSTILEALGMFSFASYSIKGPKVREFVRFEHTSDLFYDGVLDEPFSIECDSLSLEMKFSNGRYQGKLTENQSEIVSISGGHDDFETTSVHVSPALEKLKYYRFVPAGESPRSESDFLLPPSGANLFAVLLRDRKLLALAAMPFRSMGLHLLARPQEGKLEVQKQVEDTVTAYPFSMTSETFQRLTFYLAAIKSNSESVLIFEEPESHAFPYYTKHLAELIALDTNENQYFVSTHNPYFLLPIVEKAPKDEVAVHIICRPSAIMGHI